jgi:hypothetical protein
MRTAGNSREWEFDRVADEWDSKKIIETGDFVWDRVGESGESAKTGQREEGGEGRAGRGGVVGFWVKENVGGGEFEIVVGVREGGNLNDFKMVWGGKLLERLSWEGGWKERSGSEEML